MRIVLTGGGTQGHVIPFEPIIEALRLRYLQVQATIPASLEPAKLEIQFFGVVDTKTKDFFAHYDVRATHIPSGKWRRYFSLLNFFDMAVALPFGIASALVRIFLVMPDVVISKGGYGSLPTVIAAAFYRIPIILHESDAVPGAANLWLMKFASAITLGFTAAKQAVPQKYRYRTIITGTPVRGSLRMLTSIDGKKALSIKAEEKVLLVSGGSQGAQQINEAVLQILARLVQDFTVIHVTGEAHLESIKAVTGELLGQSARREAYKPYGYLTDQMPLALACADGVVSRAGSGIIEQIALRKPMLLIPLASAASDHQRVNARVLEAAGAALVLEPTNIGSHLLEQNILQLMNDEALRNKLIGNMAALDFPKAGPDMAELAFSLARGLAPGSAVVSSK